MAIELTNRCNLACRMCIHHGPDSDQTLSKPMDMDFSLFQSIVNQYSLLHEGPKAIAPQFQGESLLYRDFLKVCECINDHRIKFNFTTNAMLLKPETSEHLLNLQHFSAITFSIDGFSPAVNDKIRRGSRLQTMIQNIDSFLKIRKEKNHPVSTCVNLVLMEENRHELIPFVDYWLKKDITQVTSSNVCNLEGNPVDYHWHPTKRISCTSIHGFMIVLADGRVIPCCRDHRYQMVMGHLSQESLAAIWNGASYQKLRDLDLSGRWDQHETCGHCATWMCSLPEAEFPRKQLSPDIFTIQGPFFDRYERSQNE